MKKIFLALAIFTAFQAPAQWPFFEKIEGNGVVKKETRQVSGYDAVSSSGAWDVMIAYGESNSIELEGDENLLPYIETEVKNGTLSISTKKHANLRSRKRLVVYVSLKKMRGVYLSGSGDMIGKGEFRNEGTSEFHVAGSGNIRISLNRIGSADVNISGSGHIDLAGSAQTVHAKISGSGNADCSDLITNDAVARISGSGNVKLNANKSVEANISGSGNVSYRGAATDVKKHVSGSGGLRKA